MTNPKTPNTHIGRIDDYAALKAYGHSPAKAAEIALDARRGDEGCQRWIRVVRTYLESMEGGNG